MVIIHCGSERIGGDLAIRRCGGWWSNLVLGSCGEVGRGGGGEGEVIVFNDMAIVVDKSVRGGEHGRK